MKLSAYMKHHQYTQKDFIKKIKAATGYNLPQGTLAKYVLGQRFPRKKELNIIYETTNGLVSPNDFYLEQL
jgi:hypothetical protein|tara:strand:- start:3534 stop:3746 length:213 start_codon:yes stop_codon:yes gene_type:complete